VRTIKLTDAAYKRIEDLVWKVVTEGIIDGSWWYEAGVTRSEKFFVCVEDPCKEGYIRKTLTKRQLVVAYLSLEEPTHCGGYHILHDDDICSADMILQQAVFAEQVYG
jgi:hypothetical protein